MSSSIIEVNTQTHFPIKLNPNNFPVWRKQVMATLIGLGLNPYVEGTLNTPSKTLATDAAKPNPEYTVWFRQDQTILGALLGSCSDEIQHVIASAENSYQAFERLSASYASNSRSRIISLKTRITNNPRGSRPVAEYMLEMKNISDDLALAQSPISDEDLVVYIIGQLGDEFAHVTAALKMRDNPITYPDLFAKLVDHERSLKHNPCNPEITTVNYTQRQPARQFSQRFAADSRTQQRSANPIRHYRSQGSSSGSGYANPTNRNNFFCNYCSIAGHDTKDCRKLQRFLQKNQVTIHMSSPMVNTSSVRPSSPTQAWMFDSGASHHVTSDRSALHTLSDYGGPDEIVLGNGTSLPITHTGSAHGGATNAGNERG